MERRKRWNERNLKRKDIRYFRVRYIWEKSIYIWGNNDNYIINFNEISSEIKIWNVVKGSEGRKDKNKRNGRLGERREN